MLSNFFLVSTKNDFYLFDLKKAPKKPKKKIELGTKKGLNSRNSNMVIIDSLFHDFSNLRYKNHDSRNDFLKKLPSEISSNLKLQENKLERHNNEERRFENMSKYLSRRAKKEVNNLLVHKTDLLRIKREINELKENDIPFDEKYGTYNWTIGLRRPKEFQGTRHSLINLGNPHNPIWQMVKETIPKTVEIVRSNKSNASMKEISRLKNSGYFDVITENSEINAKNFEEFKCLEVSNY